MPLYNYILMLRPLNGVEVNSLLDHLPKGRELSEELDLVNNGAEHIVDLLIGGESTNSKSNRRVSKSIVGSHSSQYIRRLQRCRGTGRARTQGNVVESHQQGLSLNVCERNVDASVVVVVGVTIENSVVELENTVLEFLGQSGNVLRIVLKVSKVNSFKPNLLNPSVPCNKLKSSPLQNKKRRDFWLLVVVSAVNQTMIGHLRVLGLATIKYTYLHLLLCNSSSLSKSHNKRGSQSS